MNKIQKNCLYGVYGGFGGMELVLSFPNNNIIDEENNIESIHNLSYDTKQAIYKYGCKQIRDANLNNHFICLQELVQQKQLPEDMVDSILSFIYLNGITQPIEDMLNSLINNIIFKKEFEIYSKELIDVLKTFLYCKNIYSEFHNIIIETSILTRGEHETVEICIKQNECDYNLRMLFNNIMKMISTRLIHVDLISVDLSNHNEECVNKAILLYNRLIKNVNVFKFDNELLNSLISNEKVNLFTIKIDSNVNFSLYDFEHILNQIERIEHV